MSDFPDFTGPTINRRAGEQFITLPDADDRATRAFRYGMAVGAFVFAAGLMLGALT